MSTNNKLDIFLCTSIHHVKRLGVDLESLLCCCENHCIYDLAQQKKKNRSRPSANPTGTVSYNAEHIIGNGSFGVVFQAVVVETGEVVAIKKVSYE